MCRTASQTASAMMLNRFPDVRHELDDENLWLSDDGLIAGAPALDALSDEALLQFLDELDVGGAGGSA